MKAEELKNRTRQYALRIIKLVEALPSSLAGRELGRQLFRSGTSVAANYRASCRAKSRADFISKLGTVEEECDESLFWIETIRDAKLVPADRVKDLLSEGEQILKIVVASIRTARRKIVVRPAKSAIRNPQSAIGVPRG